MDATENPRDYLNNLLVILFGRETLKKSCVTGQGSNRFKDKDRKPPLDPVKLQLIYSNEIPFFNPINSSPQFRYFLLELVAEKSNNDGEYTTSVVNKIIAKKIYNLSAADKKPK